MRLLISMGLTLHMIKAAKKASDMVALKLLDGGTPPDYRVRSAFETVRRNDTQRAAAD